MRGHGESKWELIEKRKKINVRKEQKVDRRSRLRGQVQMKIAVALIEGMCRIFGWFLFCFKWFGVTHGMAEHQNGGFKCHGLIRIKVYLHQDAEYTGRAPLQVQLPFSLCFSQVWLNCLWEEHVGRSWWYFSCPVSNPAIQCTFLCLFINTGFKETVLKQLSLCGSADVDECQTGVHRCGEGQLCHNLPGGYRCDCKMGYQYDSFSRSCIGRWGTGGAGSSPA